jgi:hypothetical protein
MTAGYVYVIGGGRWSMEYFKIGKATDPQRRIGELQTGNPSNLQLWVELPVVDMDHAEYVMHCLFESVRIRGEWYALNDLQFGFLRSLRDRFNQWTRPMNEGDVCSLSSMIEKHVREEEALRRLYKMLPPIMSFDDIPSC